MLSEDVEDEGSAVHDLDPHHVLQGTALRGGEVPVDDHGVRPCGRHHLRQLLGLSGAQVGGGVRVVALLDEGVQHLRAGGLGQGRELSQRGLGVLGIGGLERGSVPGRRRGGGPGGRGRPGGGQLEPHQDHLLQADLAVLDLRDVLQLGGQGGHAPGGGSCLTLQGAVVGQVVTGVVGGRGGQGGAVAGEDAVDDVLGARRLGAGTSVGGDVGVSGVVVSTVSQEESFVVCVRRSGTRLNGPAVSSGRRRRLSPSQRIRKIHMGGIVTGPRP